MPLLRWPSHGYNIPSNSPFKKATRERERERGSVIIVCLAF